MGSSWIEVSTNNMFWTYDGFSQLVAKLMWAFLPDNYQSDINQGGRNLYYLLDVWKTPCIGITLSTLSKRDFNTVVKALEKGRKYLDTLMTEEAQEEFVEDYIGVLAFDDLKYWTDETIRHCYQDPRYEAKTD